MAILDLAPRMQVDRYKIHDIEVVVDRMQVTTDMKLRIGQSVTKSLQMGKDLLFILDHDKNQLVQYSKQLMCIDTGLSYEEPSPNSFSLIRLMGHVLPARDWVRCLKLTWRPWCRMRICPSVRVPPH